MTGPDGGGAITGIGMTEVGRLLRRSGLDLTCDAACRAVADAGLALEDVDGVCTWPGESMFTPGSTGPSVAAVQDALGLRLNWYLAATECPGGPLGAVVAAAMAVRSGVCRHVLVYRTLTEGTERRRPRDYRWHAELVPEGVSDALEWTLPYGASSAAHWLAPYATRYLHQYGLTRRDLAAVALNGRRHAARNPRAIYRAPMTTEDYLDAPLIVWPLGLYDCDVPVDGATAVVVSRQDDGDDRSITIAAAGTALRGRPYYDQWDDLTTMAADDAAAHMWDGTELRPDDVDFVQAYDGFSILTPLWLEALGVCARGQGLELVRSGTRPDGRPLPVNTDGGQLSAGRLHGFGFLHEACIQLRGEAGERAVPGARTGIVSLGGGPVAACLLLTRKGVTT